MSIVDCKLKYIIIVVILHIEFVDPHKNKMQSKTLNCVDISRRNVDELRHEEDA